MDDLFTHTFHLDGIPTHIHFQLAAQAKRIALMITLSAKKRSHPAVIVNW